MLTELEPLAREAGGEDRRSAGQRPADALVEVCEQVLRSGDLPDAGGHRQQLTYVLPADWAAAQRGQALPRLRPPLRRPPAAHVRGHRRGVAARPPPRPARRAGLRHDGVERAADPQPRRGAALPRARQPAAARRDRAGPRARSADRRRHAEPAPRPGGPRPRLHSARVHPPSGSVRRAPPRPPLGRRPYGAAQPGAPVPTAPRALAPVQDRPAALDRPLAPRPADRPAGPVRGPPVESRAVSTPSGRGARSWNAHCDG